MVVVVGSVVDVGVEVEVVLAVVVDPSVLDVDEPSLVDVVDPTVVVVAIVDEALVVSMTFSNETVAPPFACSGWTVSGHTTAVCLSRCTPPGPAPCTTTTWFSPVADSVRLRPRRHGDVRDHRADRPGRSVGRDDERSNRPVGL